MKLGAPSVPALRGLDSDLRRKRLLAARRFAVHTIPRIAILLGHWDRGEIVGNADKLAMKKRAARKRPNRGKASHGHGTGAV